jgi:FixJ family two-component response regulator
MMEPTRIFVVDDDASVRKALSRLLRSAGHEVEAFESAEAFLKHAPYAGIGCLILDLKMPHSTGIDLQRRLGSLDGDLPIVFLSGHAAIPDSVQAMKRGAVDFLTKPVDDEVLFAAIGVALERHRQRLAAAAEASAIRQRAGLLTARELETAQWVITGLLNKQIAAELGISEKTIKVHRARLMQKLGATSVAELVRLCTTAGIQPISPQR